MFSAEVSGHLHQRREPADTEDAARLFTPKARNSRNIVVPRFPLFQTYHPQSVVYPLVQAQRKYRAFLLAENILSSRSDIPSAFRLLDSYFDPVARRDLSHSFFHRFQGFGSTRVFDVLPLATQNPYPRN